MKRSPLALLRLGLLTAALPLGASAVPFAVTVNPVEDTFVSAANPNSSYGSAGALSVSAPLTKGEFDSLLKFDLAAAKASFDTTFGLGLWTIQSITLRLTNSAPNNSIFNGFGAGAGGTNVNLSGQFSFQWMQNDSWVQGTGTPNAPGSNGVTYATLPGFLGAGDEALGTYAYTGAATGNNIWTLSLATGFVADATAGNAVSLLAQPVGSSVAYTFNSGENPTVSNRPLLTVTADAIPEPTTTTLLAGTAACFGLLRRRRHERTR